MYYNRIPYEQWGMDSSKPPLRDTIICMGCGKDTGIGKVLLMVIPPEGLKCPSCGHTVVQGPPQVTL